MKLITRAEAFLRDAADYFASAQAVDDSIGSNKGFEILSPKAAYYLLCHALELAAKSVLVQSGWDDKRLKKVGHNLLEIFEEARKAGLDLNLTTDENRLVGLLDEAYLKFRYPEAGQVELPVWGPLTEVAIKLFKASIASIPTGVSAIRPEAMESLSGHSAWY